MVPDATVCPQCGEPTLRAAELGVTGLRLCSHCHSTLIPASQLLQLDRRLFADARSRWCQVLQGSPAPMGNVPICPDHGQPLARRKVPDHGHDCFAAPCCDLLLLAPAEMAIILGYKAGGPSVRTTRASVSGGWNPLAGVVRLIFGRGGSSAEVDPFETAQFDIKIAPLLGLVEGKGEP